MKQVIIMVISALIIIVGGICEIRYLSKSSLYLRSDIEYIKNAIENNNFDLASKQMNTSFNSWEGVKDIWTLFINNDEIDSIDDYIIDLKKNIEFEDREECLIAIDKLSYSIENTIERQKLKLDNVL